VQNCKQFKEINNMVFKKYIKNFKNQILSNCTIEEEKEGDSDC